MSKIYFTSLCSSKSDDWTLWYDKIGWDTPNPDITLCFQYTVLNWIPLSYLWISSMIYIPILLNRTSYTYRTLGKFNIFKTVLIALLIFIHILNFFRTVNDSVNKRFPPPAMYLQPIISGLSTILLIYLNRIIYKKGIHSSGVLFFYWLIQICANIIIIYSRYTRIKTPNEDVFFTVTSTLEFLLVFASFFTNCFSDPAVLSNQELLISEDNLEESQPLLNLSSNELINQQKTKACPESRASFLSRLTFIWFTDTIVKGYRKALTFNDLFALLKEDTCERIVPKMEKEWNRELNRTSTSNFDRKKSQSHDNFTTSYQRLSNFSSNLEDELDEKKKHKIKSPSFLRSLFYTIGYPYMLAGIYKLVYDLFTFTQPLLLGLFIGFVENKKDYLWHGFFYAGCLFFISMIRSVILQQYYHGCYVTGMRTRTAIIGIIYRKALKLSPTSRKNTTVGEIVNLMSVDSQKLQDVPVFLHLLWSSPIIIVIAMYLLWQELGAAVLAGIALMICLIPVNGIIGSKIKKLQNKQMKMKDVRIKLMSEILSGIKILKLYAWENSFRENIEKIRNDECVILRSATYLNAFSAVTWFCAPFLVALCSFAAYVLSSPENVLTPNKAFVSLSLFNILNVPMSMLPGTIVFGIQAYVSLVRVNKFLLGDELDQDNVEISPANESPVKVIDGTFSWGKNDPPTLTEINMDVSEGSLVAVVGTVGSGKTSLISSLIGELYRVRGRVMCRGSIAYVPQQAWCQNASLQDNILFRKPMVRHEYNNVIEACALTEDLKVLPGGDQTEIGEKGVNLSGGQKQRISLARAVYQNASLYIFDDPLSAVDSHVGRHIFNKVIGPNGLLSGKTRILVTHGLTFLPKVDNIFVMKDGQISENGTFKELVKNNGPFAEFIRTYLEQEEEEGVEDSEDESKELKIELKRTISKLSPQVDNENELQKSTISNKFLFESKKSHRRQSSVRLSKSKSVLAEEVEEEMRKSKKKKLIEDEVVETGGVKFSVFLSYLRSSTYLFSIITVLSYIFYLACSVETNIFLGIWSESGGTNKSQSFYLGIYGVLGAGQAVFILIENFALAYGTFMASKSLHTLLLKSILRAPNSFFDTTPLGRILNRIGKDIDTVDVNIPTTIRMWLATAAGVFASIIVISISSPYFLIALIPLTFMYYMAQRFYICTSRQLKRIDSIKRSPIYSHFQESIVGASSIRAYRVTEDFINKCDMMNDENQMAWYPNILSYRWLQLNLETVGNIVILLAGILGVMTRDTIGSGYAGLSMTYALQITGSLNFMVRTTCDLESYTVAIERIKEYADIESEASWDNDETKPPLEWPSSGKVEFINYSVRYRPGLDLVLRNLNLCVAAGEKLGIVGRTGAGKSSLALALFRLIEPAEGSIEIDNINVSRLGLHDLRSKITIIPQDPVLFSGTLRMNLDPFNQYSDGELWSSLELSYLKSFVSKTTEGLDFMVSESGENLSVGQRQLVCLARALLKRTKVLVLDEATAAIDLETDDLIQNSIRKQFKSCTVLTIAHRLNTILDYDRVMVLDQGRIKELDSPQNLLGNIKSTFYSMAHDAGLV